MKVSRRRFLLGSSALAILSGGAHAASHGIASSVAPTRILIIGYGQSNMDVLFNGPPTLTPNASTSFYNGSSIVTPPSDGVITLGNTINNVTGLPVLSLDGAAGGTNLSGLAKGSSNYTALLVQINAVIQPTDQVFIIWLQGEGDASLAPPGGFDYYASGPNSVNQLHHDLTGDIGRTTSNCPFLIGSIATVAGFTPVGTVTGGQTALTWTNIRWQQFAAQQRGTVIFSHSNIDATTAFDDFHYDPPSLVNNGARFAQTYLTHLGKASGNAHWEIANAVTVDATHTNVNLTQVLGTDFTPTTGIQGFEVSGDNGSTWTAVTGARTSATQLQLTHSSLTTTSARLVRYQYGYNPPGIPGGGASGPPLNLVADNSSLALPLTPTGIWNIRPTPLTVLPVVTWRDFLPSDVSTATQTFTGMQIGNDGVRQFLVFGAALPNSQVPSSITVTPNVGSPVSGSVVVTEGGSSIFQALLGADAALATEVTVQLTYPSNPFGGTVLQLYTVPFSDISSTTATGTGSSQTASSTTGTATVNVSARGFIIANVFSDTAITGFPTASGTESYNVEPCSPSGIVTFAADAANAAANVASSFTGTVNVAGNISVVMAAWR